MKAREFERMNAPGVAPEKSVEHDVYAMLQENRAMEQRSGTHAFEIREVTSRRKRDFWFLFLLCNPLLATVAYLGRDNAFVFMLSTGAIVVFTLGLTWIMWFVMDNY